LEITEKKLCDRLGEYKNCDAKADKAIPVDYK
jgi:hypothetical protein